MLQSLDAAVSGMQAFQESLDVIGNNVANVNTTGYKSARIEFADQLSQTMGANGSGDSMQVGTGVGTSAITNQFLQGVINRTGSQTDLAVSGQGFFIVSNPSTGAQFVTRAGDFHLDSNGYLVTAEGLRVQGYSDTTLTTIGDIKVDNTGNPLNTTADVDSFNFDAKGVLHVRLTDGQEFVRGQVLLQTFRNPEALFKEGANLYTGMANAGGLAQPSIAGTSGLGDIVPTSLESSNVDLANEFSQMITTQRAYQANARVITTSDEILQELVNLKR
jgi:flagellar hook protein FlgE